MAVGKRKPAPGTDGSPVVGMHGKYRKTFGAKKGRVTLVTGVSS
jgi:hypothetical protein